MTEYECKVMEYKNKMHVIDTCRRVTPPLRLSLSSNWWMIKNPFLFVFLNWNIINKLCLCIICVVYIWRKNATDQHCLVACCVGVISGTEKPLQLWLKSFVSFHFTKWINIWHPLDPHESLVVIPVTSPVAEARNIQLQRNEIILNII